MYFPNAAWPETMEAIHPACQRLSDRFHTRGEPKVIICICFLLQSLGLPCRASASVCDRPHVLSGSQGRYVAGSEPSSTVHCTDKENRPANMHHRHWHLAASLYLEYCHVDMSDQNAKDIKYYTNLDANFTVGLLKLHAAFIPRL